MNEDFRDVAGWPEYQINSSGRIRRKPFVDDGGRNRYSRLVKPRAHRFDVTLRRGTTFFHTSVGRLVLLTFRGPPPFEGAQARHLDDDRSNNELTNLEWGSDQDNKLDAVRNGRTTKGRKHSLATRAAIALSQRKRLAAKRGTVSSELRGNLRS